MGKENNYKYFFLNNTYVFSKIILRSFYEEYTFLISHEFPEKFKKKLLKIYL